MNLLEYFLHPLHQIKQTMKKLIALLAVMGLGTFLLLMSDDDKKKAKKKAKKVKKSFSDYAHKAKEGLE